jgi:hypothetical protein
VAVAVVDLLEVVEVDEDERERLAQAARPGEAGRRALLCRAAVEHPGQAVAKRQLLQAPIGLGQLDAAGQGVEVGEDAVEAVPIDLALEAAVYRCPATAAPGATRPARRPVRPPRR